jgi:hypothetical protein
LQQPRPTTHLQVVVRLPELPQQQHALLLAVLALRQAALEDLGGERTEGGREGEGESEGLGRGEDRKREEREMVSEGVFKEGVPPTPFIALHTPLHTHIHTHTYTHTPSAHTYL